MEDGFIVSYEGSERYFLMKILIFAKPGAKRREVKEMPLPMPGFDMCLSVAVAEAAYDGAANRAVTAAIAKHFGVSISAVRIVSGKTVRKKVVVIER
jgi:uncharacterized protein YggU (UPF0235/DUF167 family)